jgi:hypothetical protein
MKVLVCGGRDYDDQAFFDKFMDDLSQRLQRVICIIQGGATGADMLARGWAAERMLPCMTFDVNPYWGKLGKKAGPIRNEWMLEYGKPEWVVAFPGGKGTADMIKQAESDMNVRTILRAGW